MLSNYGRIRRDVLQEKLGAIGAYRYVSRLLLTTTVLQAEIGIVEKDITDGRCMEAKG